jgi:hypothetical protein
MTWVAQTSFFDVCDSMCRATALTVTTSYIKRRVARIGNRATRGQGRQWRRRRDLTADLQCTSLVSSPARPRREEDFLAVAGPRASKSDQELAVKCFRAGDALKESSELEERSQYVYENKGSASRAVASDK